MREIPLAKIPAQTLNVVLDGQYCTISIYWRQTRLFLDLLANGIDICRGAICENRADVIQSPTQNFNGSIHFVDTDGIRPPYWEGLGDRYRMIYISADEEMPEGLMF